MDKNNISIFLLLSIIDFSFWFQIFLSKNQFMFEIRFFYIMFYFSIDYNIFRDFRLKIQFRNINNITVKELKFIEIQKK